jgi:quercetin dioxygenase-like cupin family protein
MIQINKIFEDKRGEIYVFVLNGREFLLFFTKRGFYRGGHTHELKEYGVVLEGMVERKIIIRDKEETEILKEGNLKIVPPGSPHLIKSLTDSWVLEWHEYPKTRTNYEPYRKIVEETLK